MNQNRNEINDNIIYYIYVNNIILILVYCIIHVLKKGFLNFNMLVDNQIILTCLNKLKFTNTCLIRML